MSSASFFLDAREFALTDSLVLGLDVEPSGLPKPSSPPSTTPGQDENASPGSRLVERTRSRFQDPRGVEDALCVGDDPPVGESGEGP